MEFFLIAADSVDFGHTRHQSKLRPNDPILQGAQGGRVIGFAVLLSCVGLGFHRVVEYFTQPCGDRAHNGLNTRWHLTLGLLQAFIDEIAGKINVSALLKNNSDLG